MYRNSMGKRVLSLRQATVRIFWAAAMALVVALAVPARAADSRAVVTRVPPVYPEMARRMKIAGSVHLEVTVDAEGRVSDVKTLSGNRMLSPAAEEAVRRWKFAPGDGVATAQVEVTFALGQ